MKATKLILAVVIVLAAAPFSYSAPGTDRATAYAHTFTVNATTESPDASPGDGVCDTAPGFGTCTLWAAITEANASAGSDLIVFDPSLYGHIFPINEDLPLPALVDPTGGTTIYGGSPKVSIWGDKSIGSVGLGLVSDGNKIQGLKIVKFETGVQILGDNNIVGDDGDLIDVGLEQNLIQDNVHYGIEISGDDNWVADNIIGGTGGDANGWSGVMILEGAQSNVIGTNGDGLWDSSEGNKIGDNGDCGVSINGQDNWVTGNDIEDSDNGVCIDSYAQNNIIGTNGDELGDALEGNEIGSTDGVGVLITAAQGNVIAGNDIRGNEVGVFLEEGANQNRIGTNLDGTSDDLERNLIYNNTGDGIYLWWAGTDDNEIKGNYIGTDDVMGSSFLGNGGSGIFVGVGASDNEIGDTASGGGNVIAYNGGDGIHIAGGTGNIVRRNEIHSNDGLGIDLGVDGVTPNDTGDSDSGANELQNFPELTLVTSQGSDTYVQGQLNSVPSTQFVLRFYVSDACDPSGYGEGETYLGTKTVTTDGMGNAGFGVTFATATTVGEVVTAVATDPDGNTSEFSACATVRAVPAKDTFEVNSSSDDDDYSLLDGVCSTTAGGKTCTLRAAIEQANYSAAANLIVVPRGHYVLTIPGTGEDAAGAGDLDITDDVQIVGAGPAATIIDGGGLDRVFHVDPSSTGVEVTLSSMTIRNGSGGLAAGLGVYNNGTLTLNQVVVHGNHGLFGGGVFNNTTGVLVIAGSTVYSNTASLGGGGVASSGAMTATNSTFSGNATNDDGGGIAVFGGTAYLNNVTVTENEADADDNNDGDGGGIANSGGTITIQNSIVAQNLDLSNQGTKADRPDCSGAFSSNGYNLVGDGSGCSGFSDAKDDKVGGFEFLPYSSWLVYDAALGPLQDNGGPTPTHRPQHRKVVVSESGGGLQFGYTVIDEANPIGIGKAGACEPQDQLGLRRPVDGDDDGHAQCDRGAVEYVVPSLTVGRTRIDEGFSGSFSVNLYPASTYTVTVQYATSDQKAFAEKDYIAQAGELAFAPGETEKTIVVDTKQDTLKEDEETFTLDLLDAQNAKIAESQGGATIVDDDSAPELSINDIVVAEGFTDTVTAVFTVSLASASGQQVTVNYATASGTAVAGSDFASSSGILTFEPGETARAITIAIWGDTEVEDDESFTVDLSNPHNATIADAQGSGTITDDDHAIYLPLVLR